MVFIFKADLVLVGGTKTAAVIFLQFDFPIDRTAVDVHVKDRHEDDDLVARLSDEIIHAHRGDLRHRAVGRRQNMMFVFGDRTCRAAEEIGKIARQHDERKRGIRMRKVSKNNRQNECGADKLIALTDNDHADTPPFSLTL